MSPRPYRMQQRLAGMDATRARIVEAARETLAGEEHFTLDAVARRAGVARLTIYDRFGSREALVEAVFDDLAEAGGLVRLPEAFGDPDPVAALKRFVEIFCGFYSTHRLLLRRLNAQAVLGRGASGQPDRNLRRLQGLQVLLKRVAETGRAPAATPTVLRTAHVLTGFAFIDELAGPDRDPNDVAPNIADLVCRIASID